MLNLEKQISIRGISQEANLTPRFGREDLDRLGAWVWEGYEQDESSRRAWFRRNQAALDLALQVQKEKSFPWPGASNVAFPLVTIAALQFHSRAYPALIDGKEVVKFRVPFADPSGQEAALAKKVGGFMSYQCLEEDKGWEEQHDRLLFQLPIVGAAFIKTQYSASKGHNESVMVPASRLVLDYFATSVESCGRKTQILQFYRNEVWEKCASGVWRDIRKEDWWPEAAIPWEFPGVVEEDKRKGVEAPQGDENTPFTFLEQHGYADLDGDGYLEPYIFTVESEHRFVVRIVPRWEAEEDVERNAQGVVRIRATEMYTKYELLPSPDGGIYGLGFGILMGPLNESVNSLINLIIDAGKLHVAGGGFLGRGAKMKSGDMTFSPFKWNRVDATGDDLRKNIVELQQREPSVVLFSLLSFLVNYTQRIAGSTDPLAGENPGQNTPKSNLDTMVEQGLKIYSALYKRAWRSMKAEFGKLYVLNTRYLPESRRWADGTIGREDFFYDSSCICPAADPNVTSEGMRLTQAVEVANRAHAVPGYDPEVAEMNLLAAMKVDQVGQIFPGIKAMQAKNGPPPPPEKILVEQMKQQGALQLEQMKGEREQQQFLLTLIEESRVNDAMIAKLEAEAQARSADAQAEVMSHQVGVMDAMIGAAKIRSEHIRSQIDQFIEAHRLRLEARSLQIEDKKADAAMIAAKKPAASSK